MKVNKKVVRKTFKKVTKAMGMNYAQRRQVKKIAKNFVHDVAVQTATALCVNAVYTATDIVVDGVTMACGKVKSLIAKPVIAKVAIIETNVPSAAEETEENEA